MVQLITIRQYNISRNKTLNEPISSNELKSICNIDNYAIH